jgi:hypothetical protein
MTPDRDVHSRFKELVLMQQRSGAGSRMNHAGLALLVIPEQVLAVHREVWERFSAFLVGHHYRPS